jgi:ribosome-associated protein
MTTPDEPADSAGRELTDERAPGPSRSQQRRDAAAVTQLGEQLVALSARQLDRLELPEELREAIALCQVLTRRARGRQARLIGQLLRAEDHDAIRQRLRVLHAPRRTASSLVGSTRHEAWRARLVDEGDPALQALVEEYPHADRQQLRALARTSRQDPEAAKTKRARRDLLRAIREVLGD